MADTANTHHENVVQLSKAVSAGVQRSLGGMSIPDIRVAEGELTTAVVMLRSALNAAVPFHRLPPEIMKAIFWLVPTMQYHLVGRNSQSHIVDIWERRHYARMNELFTLMLVCRHWRDIVAAIPSFWNTINQAHQSSRTTFLERSRFGPLKVVLHNTPSAFMSTLCDREYARLVAIYHCNITATTAQEYLGFLAPALEVLDLSNSWFFGRRILGESVQTIQLFRGHTPRLRQLNLHHVHWFPELQVSALTHLSVDMCRWDDFLAKVMGIIASAPGLIDLVLSAVSSTTPDVETLNTSYPDYSRLHLRYVVTEEAVIAILAKLSLPSTTVVDIVKALDAHHFTANVLPTLSNLPVTKTVTRASIAMMPVVNDHHFMMAQLTGVSDVAGILCTPVGLRGDLAPVASILPAQQLRELWLMLVPTHEIVIMAGGDPDFFPAFVLDPDALRETLRPMAALETLVVWSTVLPSVVEALVDHGARASRPLCPKLSCVRVVLTRSTPAPQAEEAVSLLDAQQDILRLARVQINYLPKYAGEKVERTEFDHHFPSIEYVTLDHTPTMEMPPVCMHEAHARWTGWKVDDDGVQIREDGELREDMHMS
ncbi:uncharacterized protein B0H18DRAFT_952772 [Fomitopsis serialis]|uniref:uncharacterized protein n=1 Tax=Fomitopsis serialis TaxID=139415 RepID=UPI0020073B7F|nr:uncharacterized protein B0H18DRAFT_952772 [Neoantrodia serialis]KAH9931255.1 hypothetical protein B0H18DRAFT_952772 [Neoantrodia serialis]